MKKTSEKEKSSGISRRNFLGAVTASSAVLTATAPFVASPFVLPSHVYAQEPNSKMTVGCIGMGGQMMGYCVPELRKVTAPGTVVAICDVDQRQIDAAKNQFEGAKIYRDYRELLDNSDSIDAIIIGTPDHWHVPIAKQALAKGKHVYCEKPLAHSVLECRELIQAAENAKGCATQTGNQGCASDGFRRSYEVIQAGALGEVSEVHVWLLGEDTNGVLGRKTPTDGDVIPEGFDWDFWVGTSPMRAYKEKIYHPAAWRAWYDFGGGAIADFCCHSLQLAIRALELGHPSFVEVEGDGLAADSFASTSKVTWHFPATEKRGPFRAYFYTGANTSPPDEIKVGFNPFPGIGTVIAGEKGYISAGLWNTDCNIRWKGKTEYEGCEMPEIQAIPKTLPRIDTQKLNWNPRHDAKGERPRWSRVNSTHMLDWVMACQGTTESFSPFETGAHITEIGLLGVIACRLGKSFHWDG
ncbi:MAG: Gfo/Idh/MocA family protein, partial [Thermoguttaceae bacterium]